MNNNPFMDFQQQFFNTWKENMEKMPDPQAFMNIFPYKIPGMETYSMLFDLWKGMEDPTSFMEDFQQKYMDLTANIVKGFLPEHAQPMFEKPVEFMNNIIDFYQKSLTPWMQVDEEIMTRLLSGDLKAYADFFDDFERKYEETFEKYFNMMGMGLNRESNEDVMKAVNAYNKALIAGGKLMAVVMQTSFESMNDIANNLRDNLKEGKAPTTFKDFYDIWYSTTEAAFEKLLFTDEFSAIFGEFSDKYAKYMIAMNKVYERMLAPLPIPTNKDMKSLYKTVYDLRKDVRNIYRILADLEQKLESNNKGE